MPSAGPGRIPQTLPPGYLIACLLGVWLAWRLRRMRR